MDFPEKERKNQIPPSTKIFNKAKHFFKDKAMTTQNQLKSIVEKLIETMESDETGAWIKP